MSAQHPQGRPPAQGQPPGREQDPDRQGGREPRREPNPGEEEE
ncbi:hypothetical protein [Luteimonas huabeiensis]|nr:hypothetical protein [Luteimonas huabeiensis]